MIPLKMYVVGRKKAKIAGNACRRDITGYVREENGKYMWELTIRGAIHGIVKKGAEDTFEKAVDALCRAVESFFRDDVFLVVGKLS